MKTVLHVDDDHICNFLMGKVLEKLGAVESILSVLNGKQAIDLITDYTINQRELPDIIFLDINMPIMGGFAFLEVYNNLEIVNRRNVKVIIVTSSDDPNDKLKARELGVKDFLVKPINENKLKILLEI